MFLFFTAAPFWVAVVLLLSLISLVTFVARLGSSRFPRGTVGFLHPSADMGGGGERLLWSCIKAIQTDDVNNGINRRYVLYCNCVRSKNSNVRNRKEFLEEMVQKQFQICLPRPFEVVFLRPGITRWANGDQYNFMTLFLQSICGGIMLFYEVCLVNSVTPIVIESVGIPGVYPLLSLLVGARVITYIHYPMITSNMTRMVEKNVNEDNNRGIFVLPRTLRRFKIFYYKAFAIFYWCLGQFPVAVMTNSRWTMQHIEELWKPKVCTLVYPPCSMAYLISLRKSLEKRHNTILSVGQFRPEKNHSLQLGAFSRALPRLPSDARLLMIGGTRNDSDRRRASEILEEAKARGISDRVEIRVDVPFSQMGELLSSSSIGLHTMEDEHFGIVITEYMASGCIPLAHRSGGVSLDIITSPNLGFLAKSEEEYADCMVEIFNMKLQRPDDFKKIQQNGLRAITLFNEESFQETLTKALRPYLKV